MIASPKFSTKILTIGRKEGALHFQFARRDGDLSEKWIASVITGEQLSKSDPVYLFRERMLADRSAVRKPARIVTVALAIKSWNAWRSGVTVQRLHWRRYGQVAESFPVIE